MTTAETEFAYRIDRWDTYGGDIIHHIANMNDLELAMAAYEAACKQWPDEVITLRQGARIIKASARNRGQPTHATQQYVTSRERHHRG